MLKLQSSAPAAATAAVSRAKATAKGDLLPVIGSDSIRLAFNVASVEQSIKSQFKRDNIDF